MGDKTWLRIDRSFSQAKLFGPQDRERALAKIQRPLDRMNEVADSEMFRPALEKQLEYGKSPGPCRPAMNPLLMLKMCVLQDLHGLSVEETEFQVFDRTSFRPFLGLSVSDNDPIHLRYGQSQVDCMYLHFKNFAADSHQ